MSSHFLNGIGERESQCWPSRPRNKIGILMSVITRIELSRDGHLFPSDGVIMRKVGKDR